MENKRTHKKGIGQNFGKVFDQIFGQGFDQGFGEGKQINTVYKTTRPKEKPTKSNQKRQHTSKNITPFAPLNPFKTLSKGLNPPIDPRCLAKFGRCLGVFWKVLN